MDLFAFLRAGVRSGDTPDIGGSTDDRWRELYTAASSQGVSALVWDGIRRLPPELQPSRELRLRWAYNVERIERRYGQQRRRAAELAAAYAEAGIRTVVLKGFAVSRLYPVPEHRPCGDLDCFLCGDYERGNRVAEQVGAEVKRDYYKHSHIVFRGLTVENHRFCTAGAVGRSGSSGIFNDCLRRGRCPAYRKRRCSSLRPISMPFFWPNTPCRIS